MGDVPFMSVQEGPLCSMLVYEFVSEENKDRPEEVEESPGDKDPVTVGSNCACSVT